MSKLDKQKEKISFLRTMFFFLLASFFGLVATIFSKYEQMNTTKFIISDITAIGLMCAILVTGSILKKEIDKIEEM